MDDDAPGAIEELEARIDALVAAIERCRKISVAAKIAIAAGTVWIALALLKFVSFDPASFVAAMAAAIGGVVLLGSNASTWNQAQLALDATEAARAELIERMHLPLVGAAAPTVH